MAQSLLLKKPDARVAPGPGSYHPVVKPFQPHGAGYGSNRGGGTGSSHAVAVGSSSFAHSSRKGTFTKAHRHGMLDHLKYVVSID